MRIPCAYWPNDQTPSYSFSSAQMARTPVAPCLLVCRNWYSRHIFCKRTATNVLEHNSQQTLVQPNIILITEKRTAQCYQSLIIMLIFFFLNATFEVTSKVFHLSEKRSFVWAPCSWKYLLGFVQGQTHLLPSLPFPYHTYNVCCNMRYVHKLDMGT